VSCARFDAQAYPHLPFEYPEGQHSTAVVSAANGTTLAGSTPYQDDVKVVTGIQDCGHIAGLSALEC
jgi:hypothetical protein